MKRLIICLAPSAALLALGCSSDQPEAVSTAPPTPTTAEAVPLPSTNVVKAVPADPGLKVGQAAPNFTLKDHNGETRSLDDLRKKGKVAVVFLRSIKTSPHCYQHLADLRDGRKQMEGAGLQVVSVSPDPVDVLKAFADRNRIPFPLLSDPESKTSKAYGLDDPNDPAAPRVGTVLVDESGVIRDKSFLSEIQNRQTVDELVEAAGKAS